MITYRLGNDLDLDQAIDLYRVSTLGERRPVDDRDRMAAMLRNANLVVTAWDGDLLVGLSRALTDFSFVTYLSDLGVRASHQKQGIGKELMRHTQAAGGPKTKRILLAAPAAEAYYPHVGFTRHPQCWMLSPGETVGASPS
ncbi:MAG TPA: GNAT family N-acetyltransferase [Planctomycetota bacterium]|nr:GNAT family N-acetyltransferase [Planctomycetota bacterium]